MWFISRVEQSEIKKLIRSGRYLKTFFLGQKSSWSNLQEVGQQREETILANSRPLSQTKIQNQNGLAVEAGKNVLGRLKGYGPGVKGGDQESQSTDAAELG